MVGLPSLSCFANTATVLQKWVSALRPSACGHASPSACVHSPCGFTIAASLSAACALPSSQMCSAHALPFAALQLCRCGFVIATCDSPSVLVFCSHNNKLPLEFCHQLLYCILTALPLLVLCRRLLVLCPCLMDHQQKFTWITRQSFA